jgi:uncharacterized RDD family membrane protein YckC
MIINLEKDYTLASRKRRIAAFIIDYFTITFINVAIGFLSMGTNFLNENNISSFFFSISPTIIFGILLYFAKDSIKGISPGKWIMGIMVRKDDDESEVPSFGKLFVRNLLLIFWPIEFIVLAASNDKKRLGDKIANTIVVKNPNKPSKFPRIIALFGIGIAFISFVVLFTGSAMKSSDAYKVAISEIENNEEIITDIGGIQSYGMMPTGSVNITNGYGEAELEIKVIGNEKDLNVRAYLTKEPGGEWKLINLNK